MLFSWRPPLRARVFIMSAFSSGMFLSLSLIMAIGPQNAHLIRMGLRRQHLWLTVAVCAFADIALISLGVFGLSRVGGLSPSLHRLMLLSGVLFLLFYGLRAARNAYRGFNDRASIRKQAVCSAGTLHTTPMRKSQAVMTALAFSWLNPHAWLDTAVLLGTASLAYQSPGNTAFGLGAMTGAVIWFTFLGGLACWLGQRLELSRVAHWIEAVVAVIMLAIAAFLATSLTAV